MKTLHLIPIVAALLATASLQAQPIEVRLGTILPKGLGQDLVLTKLAEDWRRESAGTVELKRAPGGSKDGEAGIVKKLASRNYQAGMLSGMGLAEIDPDLVVLGWMPLAFRDWSEIDYVRDHIQGQLDQKLAAKGYVTLFWADSGWINFFSTKPAWTPDDFRKLRLFTWAGNVEQLEIMKSLGYKPVALETDYIHANFVSGMIDAAPMPPTFATAVQIPQVATHVLDLNWSPIVGAAIVRKDVWERIPAPVREKLRKVNERAGLAMRTEGRRFHDATLAALRKEPRMHVYALTEAQRAQWDRLGEELGPKVRGRLVPERIYDEVQRLLKTYRASITASK